MPSSRAFQNQLWHKSTLHQRCIILCKRIRGICIWTERCSAARTTAATSISMCIAAVCRHVHETILSYVSHLTTRFSTFLPALLPLGCKLLLLHHCPRDERANQQRDHSHNEQRVRKLVLVQGVVPTRGTHPTPTHLVWSAAVAAARCIQVFIMTRLHAYCLTALRPINNIK